MKIRLDENTAIGLTSGSKFDGGGAGCLLSMAQSGKSAKIFSAAEIFAASINSSTIEFVSKIFLASKISIIVREPWSSGYGRRFTY